MQPGSGTALEKPRVEVLGCPIDPVTFEEAVERVEAAIDRGTPFQQVSINAAKLVKYQRDATLREAVLGCDLITADGQSIVWAARILGERLPARVAGIDLMDALVAAAVRRGFRIFLLGARPEVVERAEQAIRARHPTVTIAGRHHGYFGLDEEPEVVAMIEAARPDLLFIALETPAKELFLGRHREDLAVPYAMGVGGAFDILAGVRRRAPAFMRRTGLEWLYRFAQEPRRLGRRYLVGNSRFAWLVAREFTRHRIAGRT